MFFKTSNPSALAAWQKYQQDCQTVKDEAKRLEAVLNVACRSVFEFSISGFCFKGLRFTEDKYPFHRDLWRKPTASNGWSCTPRTSRIPKALRVASDELNSLWREYSPVTYARTDALLFWLGIDFSAILFGPVEWFCVDDVIYLQCGVKPA
ncbi:hypothetical protein AAIM89_005017, partial [Escherichia coli]|nr:hypothetical protein [Escherichia coli]EET4027732.1 hypothetical protein [Escherichia coli]EEU1872261.1 hypothetical protein [Escherichia coli]EEX4955170.1 hypothetical protein [Escherichia coli]EEX6087714.1 hypothetical protein [Escherichia coli]